MSRDRNRLVRSRHALAWRVDAADKKSNLTPRQDIIGGKDIVNSHMKVSGRLAGFDAQRKFRDLRVGFIRYTET